jgi:hypothetical protein
MKIAIMQPYFLPYIGYWQLIAAVDAFVVYDNIKYTKKGWINRNRFLRNGVEDTFSLPLRKDSDFLDVSQRFLADSFDREDLLNRFREAYRKAPEFCSVMLLLEGIIRNPVSNLFEYIFASIQSVCEFLEIKTPLVVSSTIACDHSLKAAGRVQAICKALGSDTYVNPVGGMELYSKEDFAAQGIDLKFLKALPFEYTQSENPFVPWLSILDVLMFNKKEVACEMISEKHYCLN